MRVKAVFKNVHKKYANQVHREQIEGYDEDTLRRELAESRHSHHRAGHIYRIFTLIGECTEWKGSQAKTVLENTVQFHTRRIFFIERRLRQIEEEQARSEGKRPRLHCKDSQAGNQDERKRGGGAGGFSGSVGRGFRQGRWRRFVSK